MTWKDQLRRYSRMSATVVVASVARMFLDAVGIVVSGETPRAVGFWFGHCGGSGLCLIVGLSEFTLAWLFSSYFVWKYQESITDPAVNPYASKISWRIIIGAAEWLPMSIMVGKVNMLIEFGNFTVHAVVRPFITMGVTFTFAYAAHLIMKVLILKNILFKPISKRITVGV